MLLTRKLQGFLGATLKSSLRKLTVTEHLYSVCHIHNPYLSLSWIITGLATRLTWQLSYVERGLIPLRSTWVHLRLIVRFAWLGLYRFLSLCFFAEPLFVLFAFFFLLAIVVSVLRVLASDYSFCTFKRLLTAGKCMQ